MKSVDYLTMIQQETNTQPVTVDETYREMFGLLHASNYVKEENNKILRSFDQTILNYQSVELPTPYESIVHYPVVLKELKCLDRIGRKYGIIPEEFQVPLIGTASLRSINAFAVSDFNTIVIDRGLVFFFSNLADLLTELILTPDEDGYMIKPSLLTVDEICDRIRQNKAIVRDFVEIMSAYSRFGKTIPYAHYNEFDHVHKLLISEMIAEISIRFVIAHELVHLLKKHKKSTPETESEADFWATQLCALSVQHNESEVQMQMYWVPAFVANVLDLLQECFDYDSEAERTHPEKRVELVHEILTRMKIGGSALGMVVAVRRIFILLWDVTKRSIIGISHEEGIHSIEELQTVISMLDINVK